MSQTNEQRYREALEMAKEALRRMAFDLVHECQQPDGYWKKCDCYWRFAKKKLAELEALSEPTATITELERFPFICHAPSWSLKYCRHDECSQYPRPPITACPACENCGRTEQEHLSENVCPGVTRPLSYFRAPQPAKSAEGERCQRCGSFEKDAIHHDNGSRDLENWHFFVAPGPAPEGKVWKDSDRVGDQANGGVYFEDLYPEVQAVLNNHTTHKA